MSTQFEDDRHLSVVFSYLPPVTRAVHSRDRSHSEVVSRNYVITSLQIQQEALYEHKDFFDRFIAIPRR